MLVSPTNIKNFEDSLGNEYLFSDGDWIESKDQDQNGDVRLIQLADVGVGEYLNKSSRFMTMKKAYELKCTFLTPGDILIARMPDPIGRACIFPGDEKKCVTVVDVCIVRPDPSEVDSKWLMHLINSAKFHNQILNYVTGTTRQRISRGNLSKLQIEVPPLAEQKRIAAILDKADAIRRKRQQAIQLADEFLRAVFLDMFGDPVTNPMGWEKKLLCELGRAITGSTPPSNLEGMWDGDIPFVTPSDLSGEVTEANRMVTNEGANNSRTCRSGSLLVCCIGATIGKAGIAGRSVAFNQQINAQEWNDQLVDVFGYFLFKWFPSLVTDNAIQTTLPILKKSLFERIQIVVPTKEKQIEFSEIYEKVNGYIEKLVSDECQVLFESLSQKAFSGQL